MIHRAGSTKRRLTILIAFAFSALTILAPAASAQVSTTTQIPTLDDAVGTVTDTVDSTTGTGGGGASTTDPIKETVDTTKETVSPVKETVDTTTDTVDETTGGTVGGTTDTLTETAGSTVEQTEKTLQDTSGSTGEALAGTTKEIQDTLDGGSSLLSPDPATDDRPNGVRDTNGDGRISKQERFSGGRFGPSSGNGSFEGQLGSEARKGKLAALNAHDRNRKLAAVHTSALVSAPEAESFITQLAEAAGEAVKKLAFPLGLALMVGGFLMVQGRIDRKDAKLALAPIDSEQDLLSFQ